MSNLFRQGQWKQSVQDIQGEVLCGGYSTLDFRFLNIGSYYRCQVSQFTLMAGTKKSRPDFHEAASGDKAKELYDLFYAKIQSLYVPEKVKNGVFQAMMQVDLRNDGPVCLYHSDDSRVPFTIIRE